MRVHSLALVRKGPFLGVVIIWELFETRPVIITALDLIENFEFITNGLQ